MQKRNNPLNVNTNESKFDKRDNPLTLEQNQTFEVISIENLPKFKRRFLFTRVSKDLLNLVRDKYPNKPVNEVLEYIMINHLHHTNKDDLDELIKGEK